MFERTSRQRPVESPQSLTAAVFGPVCAAPGRRNTGAQARREPKSSGIRQLNGNDNGLHRTDDGLSLRRNSNPESCAVGFHVAEFFWGYSSRRTVRTSQKSVHSSTLVQFSVWLYASFTWMNLMMRRSSVYPRFQSATWTGTNPMISFETTGVNSRNGTVCTFGRKSMRGI